MKLLKKIRNIFKNQENQDNKTMRRVQLATQLRNNAINEVGDISRSIRESRNFQSSFQSRRRFTNSVFRNFIF